VHLLLPLASSLLYVAAALFLKQAAQREVGVWRTAFVCNWMTALIFQGLLPLGGTIPSGASLWEPAIVALLFVAGQLFTFLALDKGDISIATPVLGAKVILVALFTTLVLFESVRWQLWAAATLSCAGIGLLNQKTNGSNHRYVGRTILFALQAAAAYALFDVLVMKWSPAWGLGRFLPIMLLFAGAYSFIFVPLFRQPLRAIPMKALRPLLWGALFIAMQGFILITTLAHFGDATAVNVIYCSRGLWSVLAVWWLGHWFGNTERQLGSQVLKWRLAGACLLCVSVVLIFL
jgi:drug/metabolite transporter (DMT)-like permease